MVWWLVSMAFDRQDLPLITLAASAVMAVICCPFTMAFGERLLVSCLLGGVNVLYYRYLIPESSMLKGWRRLWVE